MYRVDCFAFVSRVFVVFGSLNRHISGFRIREGALPPTVLSLHVGKWNLSTPPPADAQHWGVAGVSGPYTENGSDQVRTSDYMGGRCRSFVLLHSLQFSTQIIHIKLLVVLLLLKICLITIWRLLYWHQYMFVTITSFQPSQMTPCRPKRLGDLQIFTNIL